MMADNDFYFNNGIHQTPVALNTGWEQTKIDNDFNFNGNYQVPDFQTVLADNSIASFLPLFLLTQSIAKLDRIPRLPLVKNPAVICKAGCTDLRRGVDKLIELVEIMGFDPHDGNIYVFCNTRNSIKVIQQQKTGMVMFAKKTYSPLVWLAYQPPYMVTLPREAAEQFLKALGYLQ
jgi:hypothetical protein